MKQQYGLKFHPETIARIDEQAAKAGMTRTGLIEALVAWGLDQMPLIRPADDRLPLSEREDAFGRATKRVRTDR